MKESVDDGFGRERSQGRGRKAPALQAERSDKKARKEASPNIKKKA